MNELLNLNSDNMTVSARELHEKLNIKTRFSDWFPRMCEYGFTEGKDFYSKMSKTSEAGGRPAISYEITLDMAKEICMIQRTAEGKQIRQYLIDLEKAWNTPELVMARGLKAAQQMIEQKDKKIHELKLAHERMRPKEVFTDAVTASDSSILIRDLAKIIKQNGVDIGEKRLYKWLRDHDYIMKHSGQPTQRAMDLGLFEIIERTVQRGGDKAPIVSLTTKVTGKGQVYFINKFLVMRRCVNNNER